jgi:hypothetical protein
MIRTSTKMDPETDPYRESLFAHDQPQGRNGARRLSPENRSALAMRFAQRSGSLLQWLLVLIAIGGVPAMAQEQELGHLMEKTGALVWEMIEEQTDFGHRRSNRDMTPEKVQQYARKVAGQLARSRDRLELLQQEFPPGNAFAGELATFLKRWPDESAFFDSLFAKDAKYSDNLGAQLYGLGSQAHDTRSKWKTPFPLFRP